DPPPLHAALPSPVPCATADVETGWSSGPPVVAVSAGSRDVTRSGALARSRQRQGDAQGDAGSEGNAFPAVLACHVASAGYPGRRQSAPAAVDAVWRPAGGARRFFRGGYPRPVATLR